MAGKIDQVVIVDLEEDTKYHAKGTHAMNVKVAEILKKAGVKMKMKPAKEVMDGLILEATLLNQERIEAQEKVQKSK